MVRGQGHVYWCRARKEAGEASSTCPSSHPKAVINPFYHRIVTLNQGYRSLVQSGCTGLALGFSCVCEPRVTTPPVYYNKFLCRTKGFF